MNKKAIKDYWEQFLVSLPADSALRSRPYAPEAFGDNPELADELSALIVAGEKTATCSALWEWEAEGASIPEVGTLTLVLDGSGQPVCIIETTQVDLLPFNQVEAQFAFAEGEGDRSLEYWWNAHWRMFSRTLPKIGKQPNQEMPLVCERFRLIYKES
jgi:uncharacterized protein YhfF